MCCCATLRPMPSRERLPPWHERQRLPNGRELLIRPIRPEDAEPLRGGFALLEPREVRRRLGRSDSELSAETARELANINPRMEFALVATEPLPPGEALVGAVGRVHVDAGGHDGEFAILVSQHIANMGMGRYLMTRLVKWARTRKLHRLYGDVPEAHVPMIELAESLGFRREYRADAPGLVRMVLDLQNRH